MKTWVSDDVADPLFDFVNIHKFHLPKFEIPFSTFVIPWFALYLVDDQSLCFSFETIYAPNGFDFRQEVTIEEDDEDLPPLGPPLMAKILDSACGQSTQEVKLKHRRA